MSWFNRNRSRDTWRPNARDQHQQQAQPPFPGPPAGPAPAPPPRPAAEPAPSVTNRETFQQQFGVYNKWKAIGVPWWTLRSLMELASFWLDKGMSLVRMVEAFEDGTIAPPAPAADTAEMKQMLATVLANQEQQAKAAAASSGAAGGASAAAAAAAAGPSTAAAGSIKRQARKNSKKVAAAAEEEAVPLTPIGNCFTPLKEDPEKSNWVFPTAIKERMMVPLAMAVERALLDPALKGAVEPELAAAILKVLKSNLATGRATKNNSHKHWEAAYTNLLPAKQQLCDTADAALSAMATYIVGAVIKASPEV